MIILHKWHTRIQIEDKVLKNIESQQLLIQCIPLLSCKGIPNTRRYYIMPIHIYIGV